jgi:hypothetical protein
MPNVHTVKSTSGYNHWFFWGKLTDVVIYVQNSMKLDFARKGAKNGAFTSTLNQLKNYE